MAYPEKRISFVLTGYTPLLMHNPATSMSRDTGPKARKIPTAEEEALAGCYATPDGRVYLPLLAARNSMLRGATGFKVGKTPGRTWLAGALLTDEGECPLFHPETGKPLTTKDYEIDTRRAVVQKNGIQRSRPKFRAWRATVEFVVDPDIITDGGKFMLECFQRAGRFVGVLDYRPEKSGPFGRFTAELVEAPKERKKAA